jgi:hypothetical protein
MTQIRKRGTPAILICSSPFATLAKGQARVDGIPDLAMVQVEHPLGGMVEAVVQQRVEQAVPQVLAHLRSLFFP